MPGCPHADIRFCPLYVAAHAPIGIGCDDVDWVDGCAVSRGMSYRAEVERLRVVQPRLIAELAFKESAEIAKQQRARNMRAAGIQ